MYLELYFSDHINGIVEGYVELPESYAIKIKIDGDYLELIEAINDDEKIIELPDDKIREIESEAEEMIQEERETRSCIIDPRGYYDTRPL